MPYILELRAQIRGFTVYHAHEQSVNNYNTCILKTKQQQQHDITCKCK